MSGRSVGIRTAKGQLRKDEEVKAKKVLDVGTAEDGIGSV